MDAQQLAEVAAEIREHGDDNLLGAIKTHRAAFGSGLKTAREAVEILLTDEHATLEPDGLVRRGAAADIAATVVPKVEKLLAEGDYVGAVRFTRERTGLHLRDSRAIVEQVAEARGQKVPKVGCAGLGVMLFAVGWGVTRML